MKDPLHLGWWRHMLPVPEPIWKGEVAKDAHRSAERLGFMSAEHHLVRNFAVAELPRRGAPLAPEYVAGRLDLPIERVRLILDELEKKLTFVYRDSAGAVAWAYPVTAEKTPHRVTFGGGEQIYAA
jgi:hypothetical protein